MRCSTLDKAADEERNPVFRRREEEKGKTQPQLYGTYYFSVRKTLTGHKKETGKPRATRTRAGKERRCPACSSCPSLAPYGNDVVCRTGSPSSIHTPASGSRRTGAAAPPQ